LEALEAMYLSSRVLVISDFNCPFCFTLNEWIEDLGLSSQVRWLAVEHREDLPHRGQNQPDALATVTDEVLQVQRRAPEVGVKAPPLWPNSHLALVYQSAIEDDFPEQAAALRQGLFRLLWHEGENLAEPDHLNQLAQHLDLPSPQEIFLDDGLLARQTQWWRDALDRIPVMIAPTGARHLGLQTRATVEAFIQSALFEPPPGEGCQ
jgi:predicted DsbA family dithiol-disulfide isomerase